MANVECRNFTEALSVAVDAVEKHSGSAPEEILLGREAYRLFSSGFDSIITFCPSILCAKYAQNK